MGINDVIVTVAGTTWFGADDFAAVTTAVQTPLLPPRPVGHGLTTVNHTFCDGK